MLRSVSHIWCPPEALGLHEFFQEENREWKPQDKGERLAESQEEAQTFISETWRGRRLRERVVKPPDAAKGKV